MVIGSSSTGRTAGLGPADEGSTPSSRTIKVFAKHLVTLTIAYLVMAVLLVVAIDLLRGVIWLTDHQWDWIIAPAFLIALAASWAYDDVH